MASRHHQYHSVSHYAPISLKHGRMNQRRLFSLRRILPRSPPLYFRPNTRRYQSSEAQKASRIDRITSKLPRPLRKYTNGLRNAPFSLVVSFLILHELTAIVPLFALFGVFHYTNWVPVSYMTEHFGDYVQKGLARFEKYFARKGWFGFSQEDTGERTEVAMERWQSGEQKYRILVEVALAYAVTKALLPIRIIGSVWATPWFAGVLLRIRSAVTRKP